MRRAVAEIIVATLENLDIAYPEVTEEDRAEMLGLRERLAEQ